MAGEGSYVRRYSKEVHELYDALVLAHEELEDARNEQLRVKKVKNKKGERLIAAVENYHLLMDQMSKALGLKAITDNQWEYRYWDDPTFNEVMVDFR